jgi:membrane-associated protease RseP (regulator of RpoE activity)
MLIAACAVLSSICGALAMRAVAAVLRVRARFVLGFGPRMFRREPRWIDVRVVPIWLWTGLIDTRGGRAILARASAPLAMIALPFTVLVAVAMVVGYPAADEGPPLIAGYIAPGGPAERAGIQLDDRIVEAGGAPIDTLDSLKDAVARHGTQPISIEIERDGQHLEFEVVPEIRQGRPVVGIGPGTMHVNPDFMTAVVAVTMGFVEFLGWWGQLFGRADVTSTLSVAATSPSIGSREQLLGLVLNFWLLAGGFFGAITLVAQIAGAIRAARKKNI